MRIRRIALLLPLLALAGCDDSTEPARPTSIELSGAVPSGPAGLALAPGLVFTVLDQRDDPMAGVPVAVAVVAGGGSLSGAPQRSSAGPIPLGSWTLGPLAGLNSLEVTVEGLEPVIVSTTGVPGPPERLTPAQADGLVGQVGTALEAPTTAVLADAFDNPVAGVAVTVAVSGGSAPAELTSAADGSVRVPEWVLGTVRGEYTLTMTAGPATATFTALARSGPPSEIAVASGASLAAPAGSTVPEPILVVLRDSYGNPADGVSVSFRVIDGDGSLGAESAETDTDGVAAAPQWTLGRRIAPQGIRASAGSLTVDVAASIQTDYDLDVRFFGPPITAAQEAAFSRAAGRLRAAIVGDLSPVRVSSLNLAVCGIDGTAPLTETIDDLVVFATVKPIDGAGQILASAGPCYIRSDGGLPVVGVMQFDEADVAGMESRGILEDVVLHELLHVVGVGIGLYWDSMLSGKGTPTVQYSGSGGSQGCRDSGGAVPCSAAVPVENTGGSGTAGAHWRETVFGSELMTGYAGNGAMPMSRITVGSLGDIGYRVNGHAPDPYAVPVGALRASLSGTRERFLDRLIEPLFEVDAGGQQRAVPPRSPRGGREEP